MEGYYKNYKLVIVGGGAAAFSAALKAEEYGIKTAMIERKTLGGTCVNVGCVPSKNLLGVGESIFSSRNPHYKSILPCEHVFNFSDIISDKNNLVSHLRNEKYYDVLSSLENVELLEGNASFISNKKIKVKAKSSIEDKIILESDKFIIATGSSTNIPKFKGIENAEYLTNIEALSLSKKPSSLIIVGGRALGLEFAQMYSRLGTNTTLLQRSDRIIPNHEPEISASLKEYFINEGIEIITDVSIKELYQKNETKVVVIENKYGGKKVIEAEQLLLATGRKANTEDLHLENTNVQIRKEDFSIKVDSEMHTSSNNIWAAGDVIGEPMLETVAAKEGAIASENALTDSHRKIDFDIIPSAIFTSPQVASVGITENQMMEKFGFCSCKTLQMNQVPKAMITNQTKGLIKMVVNPKEKNRILGVHILSEMAADIIHEAVFAIKYNLTIDDIIDTVHVFPTLSESIKIVATSFKKDVKKLTCCAE